MEKNNKLIGFLITSAVINIILVILLIVVIIGGLLPLNFFQSDNRSYAAPADLPKEFSMLTEAYNMLMQNYVYVKDLDPNQLSQGAIRGMVQSLNDPYSMFVDADSYKMETSTFRGKYEGIGAYISTKDRLLVIVAPIVGSPAEEAGLLPGDIILKIDDADATNMDSTQAALKIQGPGGTSVRLLIARDGTKEPFEKTIVRREINIASVSSEIKDTIAYIRIVQFTQNTATDLIKYLKDAKSQNIKGIVLDLRNNPGGLLDVAIDVASQFLPSGTVVDIVDRNGNHEKIPVRPGGIATNIPMVVLVNEGSASASEVLCGPLQDYARAKLIGKKTFGKGCVQTVMRMSDGSALHVTTMLFYTPLDRPINGVGLTPDIPSDLKDNDLKDWAINYMKQQK
jgi:carboxyl-terminal processing protease